MKKLGILAALLVLSSAAAAQSCKSIPDKAARLACYDKADPGPAASDATTTQPQSRNSASRRDDSGKYVDSIGAEDALMNARLKNICRGC